MLITKIVVLLSIYLTQQKKNKKAKKAKKIVEELDFFNPWTEVQKFRKLFWNHFKVENHSGNYSYYLYAPINKNAFFVSKKIGKELPNKNFFFINNYNIFTLKRPFVAFSLHEPY